jgi:hypothetical protein
LTISRQFLFAPIFIPYLLDSHLTKVKELRTPIYEKHHLVQSRAYEIWADSNLLRENHCGLILQTPIYEICPIPIPIFQPPFFQPYYHSFASRTLFIDGASLFILVATKFIPSIIILIIIRNMTSTNNSEMTMAKGMFFMKSF